ncbi:hypothetical protein Hanom_Chr06g00537911 [Helianthus anomalus]
MALDLLYGFRNRKFWFPYKYFSLNAASITVIIMAVKLPVDLSSSMLGNLDQVAKIGSLAFMCTIMSNSMPSLASMDNKSLLANVTGLSILVITLIANISIHIRTHVIDPYTFGYVMPNYSMVIVECSYISMLFFLLVTLISSVITIPTSKNYWSLPIVSLTCIAVTLPNIRKDKVENLHKSVGEGLLYTHLVEQSLNKASEYVNIRRATTKVWHEVEDKCKWLGTILERCAYEGKTPTGIVKSFAHKAKGIVNEFNTSTNEELLENDNLPSKVIASNSMYRIAQTIIHTYQINNLEITEDELFTRLSSMIADVLAACLTNIPQVVTMRCHESLIEKREASVLAAINLLGWTTKIKKIVLKRVNHLT